ncbi:lysophospholipase [Amycolatopsis sp.]|uniref:alpha/beta hydrolase n=1 Tax=Amycolatopsis sp. TaxID=37632 RepID=UPI002C541E8A|nr:lysophospholipase [Amycolatopsis sp.]HVV07813.1 lysophospholipase [Amycolatopsis sp.]
MAEFGGSTGKVHYGHWVPPEPRAVVVFFHGLGEHIGSYEPFAAALNDAGFALWAADHAGHGRSEGVRVLIESVDNLLDDAETLVRLAREAHPDLPLVVAGHSLGSLVAALLTGERAVAPSALVLAGSSLLPEGGGLAELVAGGVDLWELRKDPAELSRHPDFVRQIREDPLTWDGGLRVETLRALGEAAPRVSTVLGSLNLPVLLLHGAEDDLAPASGAERAAKLLPDARAVIFPEDRHNILNELDRDEVYRVLIGFLDETLQGDR